MLDNHNNENVTDVQLLNSVLDGNQAAWNVFCQRFNRLIVGCVLKVLNRYSASYSNADLNDLVSEVWVALLRDDRHKLRRFDPQRGYKLSSWLGLIATNCTIDQLRCRTATPQSIDDICKAEQFRSQERLADSQIERKQSANIARKALAQLNGTEQDFVLACFGEEEAPTHLAERLGVSINTVYSRKFKIRAKLTQIVEQITANAA
jgi:RNA polymerase sigma-70 factor (ECF subfamily)